MDDRLPAPATYRHAICIECGRVSDPLWRGWLACRIDDPETDPEPQLAYFCPGCSRREFGR